MSEEQRNMLERSKKRKLLSLESAAIPIEWEEIKPSVVKVRENNVILVAVLLDDSSSIGEFGNTDNVIEGHNKIIESLRGCRSKSQILFRSQLLKNPAPINNWVELDVAQELNRDKYKPTGETPLYDGALKLLFTIVAEMDQVLNAKKRPRFSALILSDGEHFINEEQKELKERKAEQVKRILNDIFARNDPGFPNTLAFMGLKNNRVSYEETANKMGIEGNRVNSRNEQVMQIITPDADPASIRRAFELFSRSAESGKIER